MVLGPALQVVGGGPGRERLGLGEHLAGDVGRRDGALLDGPDGLAGLAIERVEEGLLGGLEEPLDLPPVDGHVHQDRGRRGVVVPDVVVDQLVVPAPFPGLGVQRDDARAEQVVAGVMTAVVVDGGAVGDDVDEPELGVGGHRGPRRHVAGPLPGVVLPGLVAELAGPGNHVELPLEVAGPHVVGEDVAGDVLDAGLQVALLGRVAHDHRVVDDDGRRRRGDVADLARDADVGVVGPVHARPRAPVGDEVLHEVDGPGVAEAVQRHGAPPALQGQAGVGVESVQEEARRGDEHHPAAVDLGVGDALPVALAHRVLVAVGVGLAEAPQQLAGRRVEGDHVAPVAGHGDELAPDQGRRGPRRGGAEAGRVPLPDDLELLEVRRIELIGRGVPGVPGVAAEVGPPAVFGPRPLGRRAPRREDTQRRRQCQPEHQGRCPACPAWFFDSHSCHSRHLVQTARAR